MASNAALLVDHELNEEVSALRGPQREYLRTLAKRDLFVLSKGILGYSDIRKDTHQAFCRFFQLNRSERRLALMPRGHLKTTIASIADSVRIALNDPEDARMLIASETAKLAEEILFEIKQHWTQNEVLRNLFPELIPPRLIGPGSRWTHNKATLNRNSVHRDATWTATGVGGASVGPHYSHIKCDDLMGLEASRSNARMLETIEWSDNIDSLLISPNMPIDWIGTRWGIHDLYAHIMELYGARMSVYVLPPIDEDGNITFPKEREAGPGFRMEDYEALQTKRPRVWFAQYCNNPISGGRFDFPSELINSYNREGESVVGFRDGVRVEWSLRELDIVLLADPNSGSLVAPDMASVVVVGVSPDEDVFVLSAWSARVSPSAFVDKIFAVSMRWRPRVIGIEKAGQQNTQHYFEKKKREDPKSDYVPRVVPLTPKNRDKETRIRTMLEPVVNGRQLFLLPNQETLRHQLVTFPECMLWDEVDALAYYGEVARRPVRVEDQEEKTKVLEFVMKKRNRITGY